MDRTKEILESLSEHFAANIGAAKIPADEHYLYEVITALQNALRETIEDLGE